MDPVLTVYSRVVGVILLLTGVVSIILSMIERNNGSNDNNMYRPGNVS